MMKGNNVTANPHSSQAPEEKYEQGNNSLAEENQFRDVESVPVRKCDDFEAPGEKEPKAASCKSSTMASSGKISKAGSSDSKLRRMSDAFVKMTKPRFGDDIEKIEKDYYADYDEEERSQSCSTSCKYLCINIWHQIRISWAMNMRIIKAHPYIPIVATIFLGLMLLGSISTTMVLADKYEVDMRQMADNYALMGRQFLVDQMETTLESLHALLHGVHEEEEFQQLPYKIGLAGEPESAPLLNDEHHSYIRNVTGICDDQEIVSHFNLSTSVVMHAAYLHGVVINSVTLAPYGVACLSYPSFEDSVLNYGKDVVSDPALHHKAEEIISASGALFSGPYVVDDKHSNENHHNHKGTTPRPDESGHHNHRHKRLTEESSGHEGHGVRENDPRENINVGDHEKVIKKEWILHIPISMPESYNYKLKNHWGFMIVSVDWDAFLLESGIVQFFKKQQGFTFKIVRQFDGSNKVLAHSDGADEVSNSNYVHIHLDFRSTVEKWVVGVGSKQGLRPRWLTLGISMSFLISIAVTMMFMMILVTWQGHKDFLLGMIPRKAYTKVRRGEVYAEKFDMVTVFFSDIVGYTNMSSKMHPVEIMKMLNRFFKEADRLADKHKLYKVETIGDAYMCVGGCPDRCMSADAAQRVALFALDMIELVDKFELENGSLLRIRCGLNSGKVVAGVVGTTQPHFSLFGDTVNTASRMESTSEEMRIQCSDTTYRLLRDAPDVSFDMVQRGSIQVKGKGEMNTWWINGVNGSESEAEP